MVSHLCLLLLSNLAYFAFILALFLVGQSFTFVTPIQFGLFCIYPCLIFRGSVIYACYSYPIWLILHFFLVCQSSILVTPIQFGLFCIYPCLIFSWSVIYACYFYPIWLILHLSLPYF